MGSFPKEFSIDPSDAKKLKGGRPLYTIALKKSWARRPTYWLGLFEVKKASVIFYYLARSWKWPKDGKIVDGSILSNRFTSKHPALESAKDMLRRLQEEKDYQIENIVGSPGDLVPAEINWLMSLGANWAQCNPITQTVPAEEQPESESNFDSLQKKRRKKAYW